ncbi:hypothetical protein G9A89_004122 [Geosiphon pyriformis]|nr:hypothetical protein G9A89_004122 [Geosiphon pyriformis]
MSYSSLPLYSDSSSSSTSVSPLSAPSESPPSHHDLFGESSGLSFSTNLGLSMTSPLPRVPSPSQNQKFKDLLVFEERLKQNLHALSKRQQKYEEKVSVGQKYVPQCNRALRAFNMHFNRDNKGELTFYRKVPKKIQEGFEKYRKSYINKKKERAKFKEEKEKGKENDND